MSRKPISQREAMKLARHVRGIRDNYASIVDEKASAMFGEEFETTWSLFAGMCGCYVTRRKNGKKLTHAQQLYIRGLSDGLAEASLP